MRVLILTPRLPWPLSDGGRVAMFELLRGLQCAGADVRVLSLNPAKHDSDVESARAALAPASVEAIATDTSRRIAPALRAVASRTPYVVARFIDDAFASALERELRDHPPDVVQVESLFLLPYLPLIRSKSRAAVVLRSLNLEHDIWNQLAIHEPRAWKRPLLRRIASQLRRYEVDHRDRLDAVLPISDADATGYRALGFTIPIEVVPCGLDLDRLHRQREGEDSRSVCFLGSLDYLPNQEAVRWLLDEIWPRVAAADPGLRLTIGGSRPPQWLIDACARSGVALLANVPDAPDFLRSSALLVVPLKSGGGMRIKIVEAMAVGTAVVATSVGAGGLASMPGRDLMIADDGVALASAILDLTSDEARRRSLTDSARSLVERSYDALEIGRRTFAFYERLLARR
jgi:polysaccharide biosynthesis protein PslH